MKLALVGPAHPFKGGISHYTTLLFRKLQASHEVRFYAFARQYPRWFFPGKPAGQSDALFDLNGDALRVLDAFKPWTWTRTARQIRAYAPDVLILPWWVLFWAPLLHTVVREVKKDSRAKIVFVCHNVMPHERSLLQKPAARAVLGLADELIVHCEQDRQLLLSLLPGARVHKIMHPVYDVFRRGDAPAPARKADGEFSLLFFGFVRPYKGLRYLLEAMPRVVRETGARLTVAGEFWEDVETYRYQARKLGVENNVTFLDRYIPSEDVQGYFSAADLVVLPYTQCTGSGILQVAFGCGRPVVATAVGSLTEAIEEGRNGFLVPPKDANSLAEAIIRFRREGLPGDPKQAMAAHDARFSWDHLVNRIETFATA